MKRTSSKKVIDAIHQFDENLDLVLENADFYLSFDDSPESAFNKGMEACTKALNTQSKIYCIYFYSHTIFIIAKNEDDAVEKISTWKYEK